MSEGGSLILRCVLDLDRCLVYATNLQDEPWIVFTMIWFDARCGAREINLTGWSVPYAQA